MMVYAEDLIPGTKLVMTEWIDRRNYESESEYNFAMSLVRKHGGKELTFERIVPSCVANAGLGVKIQCKEITTLLFACEVDLLNPATELKACDLTALDHLLAVAAP